MILTNIFLQNCFLTAGFSKEVDCFGFLLNEDKVTVNAQKHYFQEQLIRNEISKYQKSLQILLVFYEGKL